jgi:3-methyladenine DNA glycosylase AlkD
MTLDEVLRELEAAGTEQYRKVYARHGIGENMFGVSYAQLEALRKRIKRDHPLARQLWATGNHDARVLATMIADPSQLDRRLLDAWANELRCYPLTDAFARLAASSPLAGEVMTDWMASPEEWVGRAGWLILAQRAGDASAPDADFEPYLATIEARIHAARNRVRDAMNSALITIGARSDALEPKALAAAERIGKVEVDHGQTGCKTPDAASYIRKMREQQANKVAKKARR